MPLLNCINWEKANMNRDLCSTRAVSSCCALLNIRADDSAD